MALGGHHATHPLTRRGKRRSGPAGSLLEGSSSEQSPSGWVDQRERERERRVSVADASYYGPVFDAKTLKHAIPQRKHAKNDPLSKNVTRSLSQGHPVKNA
jgi:hypothetical protein